MDATDRAAAAATSSDWSHLGDLAARDPDARVRAVAIGAIVGRAPRTLASAAWRHAATDVDARVRRRAAQVAPRLGRAAPNDMLLALFADEDGWVAEAAAFATEANEDIQRADRYVLCVVLVAAALLFAGMSTRMKAHAARTVLLAFGCGLFIGTLAWLGTFPVGAVLSIG